jgi:hypothetical protein
MKKLSLVFTAIIVTTFAMAQAPEKMSYQAVVRNAANALVTNQTVGIRISLLQGSASGTAVYVETQTPTSNANGLVSIEIGTGSVVSGTFSTIDWSSNTYYVKTEIDPAGGTNYTITGTSQLLSVPYALYAKSAGTTNIAAGGITSTHLASAAVTTAKVSSSGAASGNSLMYNGTSVTWGNPATKLARTTVTGVAGGVSYSAQTSDEIVGVDVTSGPATIYLPSAASSGAGKVIIVKCELGNAGTNNITINRSGTDLINSSSTSLSITFGTATGSFRLYSDGVSRWHQF